MREQHRMEPDTPNCAHENTTFRILDDCDSIVAGTCDACGKPLYHGLVPLCGVMQNNGERCFVPSEGTDDKCLYHTSDAGAAGCYGYPEFAERVDDGRA